MNACYFIFYFCHIVHFIDVERYVLLVRLSTDISCHLPGKGPFGIEEAVLKPGQGYKDAAEKCLFVWRNKQTKKLGKKAINPAVEDGFSQPITLV